ncbi:DUF7513 family protein [Halomarina rubra]|uniref:DUF7513 domain-containing protein n=1 Tax=Halomarina rubra TaxID=2071873 RepID=A0ABD6ARJ1_9EURY|nr:hypothetical protein [Halomarina rubra]
MKQFLAGFGFRSNTPAFEVGEEFEAFVTGLNGHSLVRVGDTVLSLPGETVEPDTRVRVRVTDFDAGADQGSAELLEVLGEGAF